MTRYQRLQDVEFQKHLEIAFFRSCVFYSNCFIMNKKSLNYCNFFFRFSIQSQNDEMRRLIKFIFRYLLI